MVCGASHSTHTDRWMLRATERTVRAVGWMLRATWWTLRADNVTSLYGSSCANNGEDALNKHPRDPSGRQEL
eukprot:272535-Prorocentrum_minimum.AAC.2